MQSSRGSRPMTIIRVGLDTAKHVFQVHGVDESEQPVLRRRLGRKEVERFFAKLPPTRIGLEACGASHYWARVLRGLGHTVMLLPPQYIKPYVKRGKNDAIDIELKALEARLMAWHKADPVSQCLATQPGIGPIGAVSFSLKVADPKAFRSGRHFAAALGLTPKENATGGRNRSEPPFTELPGACKDSSEMAIGRTDDRNNPWDPVVLRHRQGVWEPIGVTHLGQRSPRTAHTGRTHALNRQDPSTLLKTCNQRAGHTYFPACS